MSNASEFLKSLRTQQRVPLHLLATALGVSVEQLTKWEAGLAAMPPEVAQRIPAALRALRGRGW